MLMCMTTSASPLDRAFTWILDRDGDLYGDEQERLRWYEASTVVLSIVCVTVTWAVAIGVVIGGREAAPALLGVLVALYAPLLLMNGYAHRRHVRTIPDRWSSKRIFLMVLMLAPYFVAVIGLLLAFDASGSTVTGAMVGGALGLVISFVAMLVRYRRERARELDELDEADDE
jgi:small-conductance mechanosensitive channel